MLLDEEVHARLEPAALICSLLAEIHRDPDKRERPYSPADFLPGNEPGIDSPENDIKEFAAAIERGEIMEQTPESIEALKHALKEYVKPAADCGKPTQIGPRGKMERA